MFFRQVFDEVLVCRKPTYKHLCCFLLANVLEVGTFLCGNYISNSYFYSSFDDHDLLSGQGHSNREGFALILMSSLYAVVTHMNMHKIFIMGGMHVRINHPAGVLTENF